MRELFAMLERSGLIGVQHLGTISRLPADKLEKLYRDVYDSIYTAQTARMWGRQSSAPTDTFSFYASASIRGSSGCSEMGCRMRKLDFLARYAALYASELTFPLSMSAPERAGGISEMRYDLEHDLLPLLYLRPLITGGIVVPVVMKTQHCIHEIKVIREMVSVVHDFSRSMARALDSQFSVVYQPPEESPTGRPTLYLNGPEEYIEHGGLVRLYNEPPRWLPRSARLSKGTEIEVRGAHRRHQVGHIFGSIADNMTLYLAYGIRRNARFLTDMRGETDFLDWLTEDERMTAKTAALRELQHCVPVLTELPIATILRIRKEEKEAFQAYRDAVTRISADILSASNRVSKRQAREMFQSAIEPELRRMTREVAAHRKVQRRRVLGGLASVGAGLAIGAYAGLPPMLSVPLMSTAALAGTHLVAKAAESACDHGPEFRQENDLYFLLRLVNEAG